MQNVIHIRVIQNRLLAYFIFFGLSCMACTSNAKTIMVLGDSISAGYGMKPTQTWVHLLEKRLEQHYPKQHKVVNASVSGETTAGALARLPKLLQTHKPAVVVIELGGNDGLRGQPPQSIQKNLENLVKQSQNTKAQVILVGMKIPPNYGQAYTKAFENNYKVVSQKYKVKLLPFFLVGVAGNKNLMQSDLIHPNVKAQPILLNTIYPYIKSAL